MSKKAIVLDRTGIPVMSRSALEAAQCALRYHEIYDNDMNDESVFSLRGSAYHTVKRHYVKGLYEAKVPMDFEIAKEAFQVGIREAGTPVQLIPEVRDIYDRHVQHFELPLDRYASNEDLRIRIDAPVPYQLETDLDLIHADRSEVEILDDKTYYVGFSEAQARELVQTRYYIWAAMQEYPGFEWYRMTYVFVRLNTTVSVRFHRTDFDNLDVEIRAMDAVRRALYVTRNYVATPGEVCGFCTLKCPVLDDTRRGLLRVKTADEFVKLAGLRIVQEKLGREIQKALKQYVAINGPVNMHGEVFAFRDQVSTRYDAGQLVDLFREFQAPTNFEVTASAIKNHLKAAPALVPEVATLAKLDKKQRFGHRSAKAEFLRKPGELEDGDDE